MSSEPSVKIEGRAGGPLMTNTFWVTDTATGRWAIVDPSYEVTQTWGDRLDAAEPPQAIWLTHGHFDHAAGVASLQQRWPEVEVWIHPEGKEMLEDGSKNGATWAGLPFEPAGATHFYRQGEEAVLGQSRFHVIEAPGHCPGSVMLLAGGHLLAGDVLFQGSVGRWDLPGGDYDTLARTIREAVMTLPEETIVYPGHGPATTIAAERTDNMIVVQMLAGRRIDEI